MKGLKVVTPDAQVDVRAEELRISQAWWQLVLFPKQLGHLEVTKPSVTLLLDSDELSHFSLGEVSPFTADIKDAEFNLQFGGMNKPLISVSGLSVNLRIMDEGASFLDIERGRVFDHRPLTAEMCDSLLQLLDPTLGDVVHVQGNLSLDVERLRVPLNVTPEEQMKQVEFEGVLYLHEVAIAAKTPLLQRILRVASDLYGKQPANVVHVVEENQIDLQIRKGRLHYDHLVLGFPEISRDLRIYSSGSVGLDRSIDLRISVPESLVAEDMERTDGTSVVSFHVTGTVAEPKVERLSGDEPGTQRGYDRASGQLQRKAT
jgi:hypothetical protein